MSNYQRNQGKVDWGEYQQASPAERKQMVDLAVSQTEIDMNPEMMMAECGACMRFENMQQQYLRGDINQADLMSYYEATGTPALILSAGGAAGLSARAIFLSQLRHDLIRFGPTVVSNQITQGPGVTGATVVRALKGGGRGMPFHYHIHRYNWYKPWTWFQQTPIIKP